MTRLRYFTSIDQWFCFSRCIGKDAPKIICFCYLNYMFIGPTHPKNSLFMSENKNTGIDDDDGVSLPHQCFCFQI